MKSRMWLVVCMVVLVGVGYRITRSASPDKAARKAYGQLESAFQDRSLLRLRMLLPDDFRVDGVGGVGEAMAACRYFFEQNRLIYVASSVRVAEVRPDEIELAVEARLSGVDAQGQRWRGLSDQFDPLRFSLFVEKRENGWVPARIAPEERLRREIKAVVGYW
ncbi:hypothetical protein HS125_06050 [bacterium]|nr:hypothetical protein [bacterium]